ncbi:hypothetical protein RFZ01_03025, partial [Acinetobacter pittii]|uniref:hypothetical protein n=1 Tax=Acinetobacter pittii TaxID=48296 RepID=UPI002812CC78
DVLVEVAQAQFIGFASKIWLSPRDFSITVQPRFVRDFIFINDTGFSVFFEFVHIARFLVAAVGSEL